jgi:Rrf2 family iron-sulfur cluster assembly transcriptional regulator
MPEKRLRRGPVDPAELLQSPLYSRTCKHALRVMERLAAAARRKPGSVRNLEALATETGASGPTLEQVVNLLRFAGLLEAPRVAQGGVRLARPASRISMLEVVRAIDGTGLFGRCILGLAQCSDEAPCPAHTVWKQTRAVLEQHLASQSVADLTRAVAQRRRTRRSRDVRRR